MRLLQHIPTAQNTKLVLQSKLPLLLKLMQLALNEAQKTCYKRIMTVYPKHNNSLISVGIVGIFH